MDDTFKKLMYKMEVLNMTKTVNFGSIILDLEKVECIVRWGSDLPQEEVTFALKDRVNFVVKMPKKEVDILFKDWKKHYDKG